MNTNKRQMLLDLQADITLIILPALHRNKEIQVRSHALSETKKKVRAHLNAPCRIEHRI